MFRYGGVSIHFKHLRVNKKKTFLLKVIIVEEIACVILAAYLSCWLAYRNIDVRNIKRVWTVVTEHVHELIDIPVREVLKQYMESIAEELYEYAWTTKKTVYRTGPAKSYDKAGTLPEGKFVKRTGITHNGWSRIVIDDEDYYIPGGRLTFNAPEGLPIAGGVKGEYQKYALSLLPNYGWDDSELAPLIYLWNRESGWNPNSHNRGSGAHGIPQALPASKMASEGADYYTNPEPQIRWGLGYIAGRYGSPSAAWAHFQSRGWY